MKNILWYLLVVSRGGATRASILCALVKKKRNAHQLATTLNLDYKTIQHHLRLLLKHKIVEVQKDKKYGAQYMIGSFIPNIDQELPELLVKLGCTLGKKN